MLTQSQDSSYLNIEWLRLEIFLTLLNNTEPSWLDKDTVDLEKEALTSWVCLSPANRVWMYNLFIDGTPNLRIIKWYHL